MAKYESESSDSRLEFTRRRLLEKAAAGSALFGLSGWFLAACGGDSSSVGTTAGTQAAKSLEGKTITVFDFGGVTEDMMKKAFGEPFSAATGAKIVWDSPTDYAKIKAQVEAGQPTWDIAYTDAFFTMVNCDTLFDPLDNVDLSKVDDKYRPSPCSAPIGVFGWLQMYNDKFKNSPPADWSAFFDTDKYPGKRGIWNFVQNGSLEAALLGDGQSEDDLYPLDLERAFAKLDTIKDDIAWFDGLAQGREQMLSGTVSAILFTSNRAYDAVKNGAKFSPQWNQHILTFDSFGVVKGAKNKEAAEEFLGYIESPEAQASFSALTSFGPTTTSTMVEGPQLLQDYLVTGYADQAVAMDQGWWGDHFDEANTAYTSWQAK